VASAVYGTCLYRRFSPNLLLPTHASSPGVPRFGPELRDIVDETHPAGAWDTEIRQDAFRTPPRLRLVMCDVARGSPTPGMVRQVLAWRAAHPDVADRLWADLHDANHALAAELVRLAEEDAADDEDDPYLHLRDRFSRIRALIRRMSDLSGVPIEPPAQTALLDACARVPGVVGGVVPGAGGYDAIVLLIEDSPETVAGLEELFAGWEFGGDEGGAAGGGGGGGGKVSILGVREEMEGVRVEDPLQYPQFMR
jgi:phosphomevalonate kinase